MTADLFADNEPDSCIKIDMPDAEVYLYPELFTQQQADELFIDLKNEISWQQEQITLYGQVHKVPRLTAWYGEPNKSYAYSGIEVHSSPWTPTLSKIKERIEQVSDITFNAVLLNLYRNGGDSVAWHADDERELGKNPVIGSVTLGEARPFQMKHKIIREEKRNIILQHGSYLLMKGTTQRISRTNTISGLTQRSFLDIRHIKRLHIKYTSTVKFGTNKINCQSLIRTG